MSEVVAQALGVVWHNLLLKVLLEHLSPFFAEERLEQKLGVLLSLIQLVYHELNDA